MTPCRGSCCTTSRWMSRRCLETLREASKQCASTFPRNVGVIRVRMLPWIFSNSFFISFLSFSFFFSLLSHLFFIFLSHSLSLSLSLSLCSRFPKARRGRWGKTEWWGRMTCATREVQLLPLRLWEKTSKLISFGIIQDWCSVLLPDTLGSALTKILRSHFWDCSLCRLRWREGGAPDLRLWSCSLYTLWHPMET